MKHLLLFAILFLTACTTTIDVTDKSYVPQFLGQATTTKDLFLCFNERNSGFGSELILNNGFDQCQSHKHVAALPVDTQIELVKVVKHTQGVILRLEQWFVLGRYAETDFYYDLDWIQYHDGSLFHRKDDQIPWQMLHITNASSGQK
jgi:hypothetical protein